MSKKVKKLLKNVSAIVVDELFEYQKYLIEEQKRDVKESDLQKYLDI